MENQKADVVIYTKATCPYCNNAKKFLNSNGIKYKEITQEANPEKIDKIQSEKNWPTLPLILINGQLIGGYDDMMTLHKEDKLLAKLQVVIAGLGDSEVSS